MSFPRSHTALEEEHQISQKEAKKSGVSEEQAADAHPLFILRSPRRDQSVTGAEPAELGSRPRAPSPWSALKLGPWDPPARQGWDLALHPRSKPCRLQEKLFLNGCVYSEGNFHFECCIRSCPDLALAVLAHGAHPGHGKYQQPILEPRSTSTDLIELINMVSCRLST